MIELILNFVLLLVLILASYDGMRIVFRGTRDYMHTNGAALIAGRIGGTFAALASLLTGAAIIVSILGWISGMGFLKSTANEDPDIHTGQ